MGGERERETEKERKGGREAHLRRGHLRVLLDVREIVVPSLRALCRVSGFELLV